jgi:hypothetical protein
LIKFKQTGNFDNTERFLNKAKKLEFKQILNRYGIEGVNALELATPKDSGITAGSWSYRVSTRRTGFGIAWFNDNVKDGVPIIILLQYGHGTRSGTYVEGRDIVNPAIAPIFDKIAEDIWKEVSKL